MDGGDGLVGVGFIDDDADLDFAGGNHLDVDILVEQGLEHRGGHAGVALHTRADDGDLRAGLVNGDVAAADAVRGVFQRGNGALGVAQGHGEAHSCRRGPWSAE